MIQLRNPDQSRQNLRGASYHFPKHVKQYVYLVLLIASMTWASIHALTMIVHIVMMAAMVHKHRIFPVIRYTRSTLTNSTCPRKTVTLHFADTPLARLTIVARRIHNVQTTYLLLRTVIDIPVLEHLTYASITITNHNVSNNIVISVGFSAYRARAKFIQIL